MGTVNFRKNDTYRNMYDGFLQIRGHVNTVDDLPVSGISKGDIYTVGDSKSMYIYNESWSPMGGSDDRPVSWNDVTDKPFYTTTYPAIDLPNGIKLVIDGYVKDDAEVVDGKYLVTDTRFDIALINGSDNTILEKLVGVIPKIVSQTTSRRNMGVNVLFDSVHMTNVDDTEGILTLNMSWSELAAFNEVVRSWIGQINFAMIGGESMIGSTFHVPTPAKPSAVKGQDYDTVMIEDSLEGYTAYYKKPDEIKKIDKEYLPDPDSSVRIKGNPGLSTTAPGLEAMGLTADVIDSVASGEIMKVLIGPGGKFGPPDLFNVINRKSDDVNGSWFTCENVKFNAYGIEYTEYGFQVIIDISETEEEIRYPQVGDMKHYRYEIQAEAEGD